MKILVVDDESDMQTLFEQRFRKEIKTGEMSFVFANSGNEALEYLNHQNPASPTERHEFVLILSDINMPGMSGLELLQRIKQKYLAPPPIVMMITAYGDDYNYQQAMSLGADDFLTKPIDFPSLKEKLKTK
ncbi:MAG: response regulator [Ginsengibacter sp.]